jgi:sortase (surface protein transpeptidase)
VDEIIGPTSQEVLTLITCAGNLNRETGRYDQRLIVRAERVADDAQAARQG